MTQNFQADVESVSRIDAVPTILEVVCRTTGMGFAAVARVTEHRWIACDALDEIGFGLKPGGELKVETTICHEIRQSLQPVVINNVAEDNAWCDHPIPAMYGFQSYISVPIMLADGSFFGTLCAIDPRPARLNTPETIGMFRLFAELIAKHLDANRRLATTESALIEERAVSELREQFIAVLGHDLRAPVSAVSCFAELVLKTPLNERAVSMVHLMRDSASRMHTLIDNLLDLARGRLGGGLGLSRDADAPLEPVLRAVIAELQATHPDRVVETEFRFVEPINCDRRPHCSTFLESSGQRTYLRLRGSARPGEGHQRCGQLRPFRSECRRADPARSFGASVPALLSQLDVTRPRGAGAGALYRKRDCESARRHAERNVHARRDSLHVPHADDLIA